MDTQETQLLQNQEALNTADEIGQATQDFQAVIAQDRGVEPPKAQAVDPDARLKRAAERVSRLMEKARFQRKRGRDDLVNVPRGTFGFTRETTLNDSALASALLRYYSMINRAYVLLGRNGPMVLGAASTRNFYERIDAMIDDIIADVQREATAAKKLVQDAEDEMGQDFIRPQYTEAAVKIAVVAQSRKTLELLDALREADKLVENLGILDWNGRVDASEGDRVRRLIRDQMNKLFLLCFRITSAMYYKINPEDIDAAKAASRRENGDKHPAADSVGE